MAKRRDRAFHLTVTVFALTLAAISAITVVNRHHISGISQRFLPFRSILNGTTSSARPSANSTQQKSGTGQGTPVKTPGAHQGSGGKAGSSPSKTKTQTASDLAGMPTYHKADNAKHVVLAAYGNDVPNTQVQTANSLLSKYQIVQTDATTLQLNLKDTVHIYLVQTPQDYERALANLFGISPAQAKSFSSDTGGFTQGESIVVPMYQNKEPSDLVNTLAHELTHAILNDNVQVNIPSWIDEGLAVSDGMNLQRDAENPVQYAGDERSLAESIIEAAGNGKLIALTSDENQVLAGNAPYDLELQDWLSMQQLLRKHGQAAVSDYLYRLNIGETSTQAFQRSFGETEQKFNQSMTQLLDTAAHAADPGVQLTFDISSGYRGYLRLLQHGSHNWQGIAARAGRLQVTMTPQGRLTAPGLSVQQTYDSTKPDAHTLYINLDPNQTLTYEGQPIEDCGLALDYHDGLYSFVNGWVTWKSGKSTYFYSPSLLGVTLQSVQEASHTDPILALL